MLPVAVYRVGLKLLNATCVFSRSMPIGLPILGSNPRACTFDICYATILCVSLLPRFRSSQVHGRSSGPKRMVPRTRSQIKAEDRQPFRASPTVDHHNNPSSARSDVLRVMKQLVSRTSNGSTICPSQIPRALHASNAAKYRDWRSMMPFVRKVAWEEVREGRIEVTQKGQARTWEHRDSIKGPIRLRKGPAWTE